MSDSSELLSLPRGRSRFGDIFSRDFVLTCVASVLFLGSGFLLIPTLPLYVEGFGASDALIGLMMGAFSASAVGLRPWVGRQIEQHGSRSIMTLGAAIFMVGSLTYSWAGTVWFVLLIRLAQGAGLAAFMTASRTLVAEVAPAGRTGEALGFYHVSRDFAFSIGPALGLALLDKTGFTVLFLVSALVAGSGMITSGQLKGGQPLAQVEQRSVQWLNREAVFPALIMVSLSFTYGPVLSFIPVYADKGAIDSPSLFFTVYALTALITRIVGGRVSDRFGRAWAIVPGLLAMAIGLVLIAYSSQTLGTVVSGLVYGFGFAAAFVGLMAYTVDRAGARGSAMATFTAAYPLGIGVGSTVMGFVLEFTTFRVMILLSALVVLSGLAAFLLVHPTPRPHIH